MLTRALLQATLRAMSHSDSLCFGLLAGGQSRRMGTDKAALLWLGIPLWQHQLRLASEIGASEILISGKSDGPYRGAARIVTDDTPNCGPIAGVAALLAAMKSEWLLVAGVDMPFLNVATLQRVLALRCDSRGVVPVANGRAQALSAVYPRAAAALANERVTAEDRSLQTFVLAGEEAGLVRPLAWPETKSFRSLNTPEEWNAALEKT